MPPLPEKYGVEGTTNFVDCPAYADTGGTARCGLPAEVEARYILRSTDGPVECARIWCPRGHWFNGPIEAFTTPDCPATTGRQTHADSSDFERLQQHGPAGARRAVR